MVRRDLKRKILGLFLLQEVLSSEEEDWLMMQLIQSDAEEDVELLFHLLLGSSAVPRPIHRMIGFVERIVPTLAGSQFKYYFKMSKEAFEALVMMVLSTGELKVKRPRVGGKPPIYPMKQVLVALWMLGSLETYYSIGDRFDISVSTAVRCVRRVCRGLVALRGKMITWPSVQKQGETMEEFQKLSGIPGIIGVIDCCLIRIRTPRRYKSSYKDPSGNTSMSLLATCDHQCRFIDTLAGYPGSIHKSNVLENSPLFARASQGEVFTEGAHIVGDAGFPLMHWLLVPYKEEDTRFKLGEIRFNQGLKTAREVIQTAFSLLKGRWCRLQFVGMDTIQEMPYLITAACVLHNYCLMTENQEDICDYLGPTSTGHVEDSPSVIEVDPPQVNKRARLTEYLASLPQEMFIDEVIES